MWCQSVSNVRSGLLQLLKLLATEAADMATSLEGCGVRDERVTKYIAALQSLASSYDKVCPIYIYIYEETFTLPPVYPPLSRLSESF